MASISIESLSAKATSGVVLKPGISSFEETVFASS
jgi:hypothetical protein